MANQIQTVDPAVTRRKFDREVAILSEVSEVNRHRGVVVNRVEFPNVVLSFVAFRLRPAVIAFTVKINFDNYDVEPPSVQFIDPITEAPITIEQLPTRLPRMVSVPFQFQPGVTTMVNQPGPDLVVYHPPFNIPFLCLTGLREYHNHTFHSNDPWLTHRGKGEGTLGFIIDQLCKFGTNPIVGSMPNQIAANDGGNGSITFQFHGMKFIFDPALISL